MNSRNFYDKHAEHQDNSSLGKLRSKYWTTKQLVIKKLGKEEDEFVIASDADVDAKLDLLYTVKQSCQDLLRIMNHYETNVLFLSHEETDMARFLKEFAQLDKTRAGKMMASISKVLAYTAHQRIHLRQPLLRLQNEIETFRHRAVTDTLSTVKRMETARTEYRGSILWLKDASAQLDPERELEKFRRVQSQVKTTKTEYDRLKSDVIQKIDLLTASRCNMYSHALATYQKALLVFWEKTSKTMSAVAESFKGYQYYEFTVIKDLAEPSRLLAEMNSKPPVAKEKPREPEETNPIEAVNTLIDITDDQLDDQLLELEKLTTIDRTATKGSAANAQSDTLIDLDNGNTETEKLFSDLLSTGNTTDLLDSQWSSAFTEQQQQPSTANNNSFLPASLLSELLTSMNKPPASTPAPSQSTNQKPTKTTTKPSDKSNWLNLFAELDPIQNPDAIGKSTVDEADRNC